MADGNYVLGNVVRDRRGERVITEMKEDLGENEYLHGKLEVVTADSIREIRQLIFGGGQLIF